MKSHRTPRIALVAAIALAASTPALAVDSQPQVLAQAGTSAGSNDKASSSPALVGRPDSVRSTTPGRDANSAPTGSTPATSDATRSDGTRSAYPGANPGTSGFRHWWTEQAKRNDGRVTHEQYTQEMERRWREMDRGQGLTPAEIDRLHGWGPGVQPGVSNTTTGSGFRSESDNAQAK